MQKIKSVLTMAVFAMLVAVPAHAEGVADIISAMDIATIAGAVTTFFVAAAGVRVVFVGYKLLKSALGRA